ncbi:MAG: hypothetical protein ACPHXR_09665 [Flavicella sp.]
MKTYVALFLLFFNSFKSYSQDFSVSLGTDIPYQHYVGLHLHSEKIEGYYRLGILAPPYSDYILNISRELGVSENYIEMIENAYDFGWMNTMGMAYKFGKKRRWHIGAEFRLDFLTANETPYDLIEIVTGITLQIPDQIQGKARASLGMKTYALGIRGGYSFPISIDKKHQIRVEVSAAKHSSIQTRLKIQNKKNDAVNTKLNNLFWEDVFRDYGYLGGIGIAYIYDF